MSGRQKRKPERDREVFNVLHAIRDYTAEEIAENTWVRAGTIRKWRLRDGGTRYPQHATMVAVLRAVGKRFGDIVDIEPETKPVARRKPAPAYAGAIN